MDKKTKYILSGILGILASGVLAYLGGSTEPEAFKLWCMIASFFIGIGSFVGILISAVEL